MLAQVNGEAFQAFSMNTCRVSSTTGKMRRSRSKIIDVDANDNLESLIAASGGDKSLRYRVLENGKPVGELDMRELVKALVPRISSSEAGTRYH